MRSPTSTAPISIAANCSSKCWAADLPGWTPARTPRWSKPAISCRSSSSARDCASPARRRSRCGWDTFRSRRFTSWRSARRKAATANIFCRSTIPSPTSSRHIWVTLRPCVFRARPFSSPGAPASSDRRWCAICSTTPAAFVVNIDKLTYASNLEFNSRKRPAIRATRSPKSIFAMAPRCGHCSNAIAPMR